MSKYGVGKVIGVLSPGIYGFNMSCLLCGGVVMTYYSPYSSVLTGVKEHLKRKHGVTEYWFMNVYEPDKDGRGTINILVITR